MKRFFKISASSCQEGGSSRAQIRKEFYLNIDLIGAIEGENIFPKEGPLLTVTGGYFKEIKLVEKINLQDL